jgi:hypothetical protein
MNYQKKNHIDFCIISTNDFPMVCNLYIHLVLNIKKQSCLVLGVLNFMLVLKEVCVNRFDSCVIWLVFFCPSFLWMTMAMDLSSNGYIVNIAPYKGISLSLQLFLCIKIVPHISLLFTTWSTLETSSF